MKTINRFIFIIFIILFIGCNSLPKNVTKEEYNKARDYVSRRISGMSYLELSDRLARQAPPQYFPDGGLFNLPYRKETPGSDYVKYNDYMMEISNKMNLLTRGYNLTDQAEGFYSWVYCLC